MFRSHSKSGWNRLEIFAVSKGFDQLMKLIGRVLMEAALATLAIEEDMNLRLVAKEMEKEHLDRWTNERDRAIQLLHEGIGYLTNLKEYWAGITRHFQSIHNIIKATRASKLIDLTERSYWCCRKFDRFYRILWSIRSWNRVGPLIWFIESPTCTWKSWLATSWTTRLVCKNDWPQGRRCGIVDEAQVHWCCHVGKLPLSSCKWWKKTRWEWSSKFKSILTTIWRKKLNCSRVRLNSLYWRLLI